MKPCHSWHDSSLQRPHRPRRSGKDESARQKEPLPVNADTSRRRAEQERVARVWQPRQPGFGVGLRVAELELQGRHKAGLSGDNNLRREESHEAESRYADPQGELLTGVHAVSPSGVSGISLIDMLRSTPGPEKPRISS